MMRAGRFARVARSVLGWAPWSFLSVGGARAGAAASPPFVGRSADPSAGTMRQIGGIVQIFAVARMIGRAPNGERP
jgi:hypothetical protein